MRYCESCQMLTSDAEPRCGACGGALREPLPNDPALLFATDAMRATFVEPLLIDSGIPYSKRGDLGVGFTMRAGAMLESYRFFVPCGAYEEARALIESALGEDPAISETLGTE